MKNARAAETQERIIGFETLAVVGEIEMAFIEDLQREGLCACAICRYPLSEAIENRAKIDSDRIEAVALLDDSVLGLRQDFYWKYGARGLE